MARVEVDRLHPVRVQLRHRGAARRRRRAATSCACAATTRIPSSKGYACEKPSRLDFYQNGPHRLTKPLRRRADGTLRGDRLGHRDPRGRARSFAAVRDAHGGESIFYYGGGGQGNHLPGAYGRSTRSLLGMRYQSSALAQEKTGEFWVAEQDGRRLLARRLRALRGRALHRQEPVVLALIPRARVTLREIANDPDALRSS